MTSKSLSPVLLIHGMWSRGETLRQLRAVFEEKGHKVYAPDLPCHMPLSEHTPASKAKLAQTGVQDYVDFLEDYTKEFESPPIIVGHSMGALLAQLLAQRVECERLIVLSSAGPAGINAWSWSVVRTFGHNLFKFPLWKRTTELHLSNIAYGVANTQKPAIQEAIAKDVTLESGRASTEIGMWFMFRHPPTKLDTQKIRCPVLILSGLEDRITPSSVQEKLLRRYKGQASLRLLEGVCHWTIADEHLPKVAAHIFDWLDEQALLHKQAA